MTVARWGPDSLTTAGGVPLANLSVAIHIHGAGLAQLYTDETGDASAANPTSTDDLGNLQFFAAPGDYDIVGNGDTITVSLAEGGGGGGGTPNAVPIGDPAAIEATDVTYTDPYSGNPITVLTFTKDTAAVALALEGDSYPQVVIRPDASSGNPVFAFSDGTFDPMVGPNGEQNGFLWQSDPTYGLTLTINSGKIAGAGPALDCQLVLPRTLGNITDVIGLAGLAAAQQWYAGSGLGFTSWLTGGGNPNTLQVPGNLNDFYVNGDAAGVADWIWQCTTAGVGGSAVWTELLAAYAPLNSPEFTGTPTVPNQTPLMNNTTAANTAYVDSAVAVETTRAEGEESAIASQIQLITSTLCR